MPTAAITTTITGRRLTRQRLAILVSTIVLLGLFSAANAAAEGGVSVVGANESYRGLTYGQWSEAWWDWAAQFPSSVSPLTDTTGKRCQLGHRGRVFFLAGTTGGSATRQCTIPPGTALVIPVLNSECSTADNDCGGAAGLTSYEDLLDANQPSLQGAGGTVTIDGTVLASVRAASPPPPFPIQWVPNNPFGVSPGPAVSVADGYWLIVRPLPAGTHTLHIVGQNASNFVVDVIYNLTVLG